MSNEEMTPDATSTETTAEGTNTSTTVDFKASLPDDLKNDPTISKFTSVVDLAKSHRSAQQMLGSRIPIPGEDASDEVKNEFYQKVTSMPGVVKIPDASDPKAEEALNVVYDKLGRPETPDKYELNVPEGMPVDQNFINEVKQVAHKVGLNQKQLDAFAKLELDRAQAQMEAMVAQRESTKSFLKKEWGNAFEENSQAYKAVVANLSKRFPEAVQELINSPAGNNPALIMMATELGKVYKQNGTIAVRNQGTSGLTPEMARQQIAEIQGNKNHAYFDAKNPGHEAAVAKMAKLHADAYPEEPKE